jgi:hypothetical protein
MDEINARKILGSLINKNNTLLSSFSPYISSQNEFNYDNDKEVTEKILIIDGRFSGDQINELEAIVWWFKNINIIE